MKQHNERKKEIHIVFKSHLDIGFTDLAQRVVDQYIQDYIPKALDLIDRLHESPLGFKWTTAPWIIREFLEHSGGSLRKRMEKAIGERDILWHALPFTLHSELATAQLFRAGLEISRDLDREFGVKTISGKFTDVPGHTQAIIPLLAEYGIRFLHIGTNPACIPAEVPPLFRWRSPDGSEVIVNYQTGYGNVTDFAPAQAVLWFSHQQDNEQPPSIEMLTNLYQQLTQEYPGAHIAASGIDDFAVKILPFSDDLPLVEEEIGDTWIHGVGTDPLKVSRYRALCRFIAAEESNVLDSEERARLMDMKQKLLLIPEHTWGMDLKRFLPDYLNYRKADFQQAQLDDIIPKAVQDEGERIYLPPKGNNSGHHDIPGNRSYREFESSWQEQRGYIEKSLVCLNGSALRRKAEATLTEVEPRWISPEKTQLEGFQKMDLMRTLSFGSWTARLSARTGALTSLFHHEFSLDLCRQDGALGLYRYEVYSDKEYRRFYEKYLLKDGNHYEWSLPDYTKPGLDRLTDLVHRVYLPVDPVGYILERKDEVELRVYARMPREAWEDFGAPRKILSRYQLRKGSGDVVVTFHWRGKDANRIPESSWLYFNLATDGYDCFLDKMGLSLSPRRVVKNGNRTLHAVESGLFFTSEKYQIQLLTRDAPLVSIGKPRILDFDQRLPLCDEGVFFNLHNNLWGTNFPMWYADDGMFEFTIRLRYNS